MTLYPAGTDIKDIPAFNRGDKVTFNCIEHTDIAYRSKDPFVSQWFPANQVTTEAEDGIRPMHCNHTLRTGTWVTSYDYESGE